MLRQRAPTVAELTQSRRSDARFGLEWFTPGRRSGEYCHRSSPASNRPAVHGPCACRRNLPANSPTRFTLRVAAQAMRGHRPPALGGSGTVPRCAQQLTERHPGPMGITSSGMRAAVQKTRPRRTGKQTASGTGAERTPATPGAPETPVGKGRPTHVRTRLILAAAVVAAAVAGAGAPPSSPPPGNSTTPRTW